MEELFDIKLSEQIPWKEMPTVYAELTGDTHDWKTIRRAMLRDADELIPERVNRRVKETVARLNDQTDMVQMILIMLRSRFSEWILLNERRLQAALDDPDAAGERVKFGMQEIQRMDEIWNDTQGFFFRISTLMRDLHVDGGAMLQALMPLTPEAIIEGEAPKELQVGSMEEMLEKVQAKTTNMMEGISQRHKDERRGHSRELPALEEDLVEDDG